MSAFILDFMENVKRIVREDGAHTKIKMQLPFTKPSCKHSSPYSTLDRTEQFPSPGNFHVSHDGGCCCVSDAAL